MQIHRYHRRRKFRYDSSLVLYLPLYELDGDSFASKDRFGHLATVTGALWTPEGRDFDGVDDQIVTAANIGISGSASRTMLVWAKCDTASLVDDKIANIVGWGNDTLNGNAFSIATFGWTTKAGQWALFGISRDTESSGLLTADVWYLLGATYNGTTVQLYQNGVADNSEAQALNTINTTLTIAQKLGVAVDRLWFKGSVGEVWVYNRALTAGEILQIYQATKWRYR